MERKEETRKVKKHLIGLGYKNIRVGHGTGTAWSWLEVSVDIPKPDKCCCTIEEYGVIKRCQYCGTEWQNHNHIITKSLIEFTGRHGDYDGNILVEIGWL